MEKFFIGGIVIPKFVLPSPWENSHALFKIIPISRFKKIQWFFTIKKSYFEDNFAR